MVKRKNNEKQIKSYTFSLQTETSAWKKTIVMIWQGVKTPMKATSVLVRPEVLKEQG